jgi:hypothetical protein
MNIILYYIILYYFFSISTQSGRRLERVGAETGVEKRVESPVRRPTFIKI